MTLYLKQVRYHPQEARGHPFDLPFLEQLNQWQITAHVTFIVGENGVGKSTLIETIAELMALNLEGGSRNNQFSSYQESHPLAEACQLVRYPNYPKDTYFYRAETYYNLMTDLDQLKLSNSLFGRESHHFSRGESFKELVGERFFGNGFYLLDEPETGLSLNSQFQLLVMIKELVQSQSQLIIATHSPVLLMYPEAAIVELTAAGMTETSYRETQLFQEWQMLFERQEIFIDQLLNDEQKAEN